MTQKVLNRIASHYGIILIKIYTQKPIAFQKLFYHKQQKHLTNKMFPLTLQKKTKNLRFILSTST